MKKIIALIDGSAYAESVCDHAGWMASRRASSLFMLHVLGPPKHDKDNVDLSGSIGLGARTALLEELAELDAKKARLASKRGRAILEDARDRAVKMGAKEITIMVRHGYLLEALEEFEGDANLIVIGKRGEDHSLNTGHLGSNLERVVRSTHLPVLVASQAFKPITKMLIAFDGGASSKKAVEYIVQSPSFKGIECLLVQAGSENANNQKALADAVAALRDAGFTAESSIVAGQPETVIASTVESQGFDLLIMGAYGHSHIRNLIIGSTTTQMISACKIPVMLFR